MKAGVPVLLAGALLASCHDFQKAYENCLADGGHCVPPGGAIRNIGEPCGTLDRCATGTCVDGYCCDSACAGQCEACDVPGSLGTCTAISGQPRGGRQACVTSEATCAGACDGTTRATCAYPGIDCRARSCSGGQEISPASCSAGACPALVSTPCMGGICGATTCATIIDLALGYDYSCVALSDGSAWCWGANGLGQLGVGDDQPRDRPTRLTGISGVTRIFASKTGYHTCAIRDDQTLWCWGANSYGQLGLGSTGGTHYSPAQVAGLAFVESVALGLTHTCAVTAAGNRRAYCWGDNTYGQLGIGTSGASAGTSTPMPVCGSGSGGSCTSPGTQFQVSAGRFHTCATLLSDNISCWGLNSTGQLGLDPAMAGNNQRANPVLVTSVNGAADLVFAGQDTTCVLSAAKVPQCFGYDRHGQLASGAFDTTIPYYRYTPGSICRASGCSSTLSLANTLAIGEQHACAIESGGAVRCWGRDSHLQLGDTPVDSATPLANTQVNFDLTNAAFLDTGSFHTCAATATALRCWGWNGDSQIGSGSLAADVGTAASPLWP